LIGVDALPSGVRLEAPSEEELRIGYHAYRVREARALIGLLPREVIRPLYRKALRGVSRSDGDVGDPLAVLMDFCESLLPLPPFDVWRRDLERNPSAHLQALDEAPDAPTAAAPETLEARSFESRGSRWVARCRAYRDGDAWRGFIAFQSDLGGPVHRTTLIFREADPAVLRDRFLGFDFVALEAFLRSTLP